MAAKSDTTCARQRGLNQRARAHLRLCCITAWSTLSSRSPQNSLRPVLHTYNHDDPEDSNVLNSGTTSGSTAAVNIRKRGNSSNVATVTVVGYTTVISAIMMGLDFRVTKPTPPSETRCGVF